jgi:hypothetical protein
MPQLWLQNHLLLLLAPGLLHLQLLHSHQQQQQLLLLHHHQHHMPHVLLLQILVLARVLCLLLPLALVRLLLLLGLLRLWLLVHVGLRLCWLQHPPPLVLALAEILGLHQQLHVLQLLHGLVHPLQLLILLLLLGVFQLLQRQG